MVSLRAAQKQAGQALLHTRLFWLMMIWTKVSNYLHGYEMSAVILREAAWYIIAIYFVTRGIVLLSVEERQI